MAQREGKIIRYSNSFRRHVVEEVEQGMSIYAVQKRYGIKGGSTIQKWLRKFGKTHLLNQVIRIETMEEKDRIKHLEEEIKKLKLALADSLLAQRSLEVVIDEANRSYKTDLKKSFGESASNDSEKSSV
jgi:transposase-like protein